MLEQLLALFAGKPILITHINHRLGPIQGTCVGVIKKEGVNNFDIEVNAEDGYQRVGIVPDTITETSAEGLLGSYICGRRKIELI